jgi:putative tricarboxylic transport membrane protein
MGDPSASLNGCKMNLRDGLSGLFWLIIALFVCVEALTINIGNMHSPGPGFLPFWSGVALGMFSIGLLIKSVLQSKMQERISTLWKGMKWHNVILVLASLIAYTILLPRLGYLITTSGLLAFLFCITKSQKLWIQVVIAIIIALVSYLVFYVWLGVPLPKGILSF